MLSAVVPVMIALSSASAINQKLAAVDMCTTSGDPNSDYQGLDFFEYRFWLPGKPLSCMNSAINDTNDGVCSTWDGPIHDFKGGVGRRLNCVFYTDERCRRIARNITSGTSTRDSPLLGVHTVRCTREPFRGPFPAKSAFIRFGSNMRDKRCVYYDGDIPRSGTFGLAPCPDPKDLKDIKTRAKFGWVFNADGSMTTLAYAYGKSDRVLATLAKQPQQPQMVIRHPDGDTSAHQKFVYSNGAIKQAGEGPEYDVYLTATKLRESISNSPQDRNQEVIELAFLAHGANYTIRDGDSWKMIKVTNDMQYSWNLEII